MLPDLEEAFERNVTELERINIHMNRCNKSAIIIPRPKAIRLHKKLTQLDKPSFYGKDFIVEIYLGYRFWGYFPPNLVLRARYLFEAGIFEWWKKYFDFAIATKKDGYDKISIFNINNPNKAIEENRNFIAVAVLTIIPSFGLLMSLVIFICFERQLIQNMVLQFVKDCFNIVVIVYQRARKYMYKLNTKHFGNTKN